MTLLIGIPYHLTKSLYTLNHSLTQNNIELKKFKRNIKIFKFFFSNSRHIENIRPIHNEVVLGNPNASFEIVGVTNPLCGYCKAAFESYMKILKSDSDDICIRLRFNSGSQFKDQTHVKISFRLMEIYFEKGHKEFIEALEYWYENKDIDDWFKNYGLPDYNKNAAEVLSSQKDWLDHNELNYTPATFLNNVLYPKEYSYDEFPFFISELIDSRD
jgi:protein-disulfide isomerase